MTYHLLILLYIQKMIWNIIYAQKIITRQRFPCIRHDYACLVIIFDSAANIQLDFVRTSVSK